MSLENEENLEPKPSDKETNPEDNSLSEIYKDPHSEKIASIGQKIDLIRKEVSKIIVGQTDLLDMIIAALITNGHVLIEGVPGIAKTLTSKLLARTISAEFSRIQFTPDLMPSDIIGTNIFDMKLSEFQFKRGPIFSNLVLIDEINRAPAKTQAALMEVMEEEQVTIDGKTYDLKLPFFVIATQNPVEQEGTYKLPEAQLDRFMFKLEAKYPNENEEFTMLSRFQNDFYGKTAEAIEPVVDLTFLQECREMVENIHINDDLLRYIAEIIGHTRNNSDLYLGASPRASLNILKGSKAIALLSGRSFVTPDDIKKVIYPVLNHRIILSYEREIEGVPLTDVIESLIRKVDVPR